MKGIVSEKGQVTIPKALRESLGIHAGEALEFQEEEGRLVATKIEPVSSVDAVYGIIKLKSSTDELISKLRGPGPGDGV
jgi:antitoxin PrlF